MNDDRLFLASASPRRRELLRFLGVRFEAVHSGIREPKRSRLRPLVLARQLACRKALDVSRRHPQKVILAADTVVADRGRVLGKPEDALSAARSLRRLRGRWHRVITAVAMKAPGKPPVTCHAVSRVLMADYGEQWISSYVKSGRPLDKAGAYGIQDGPWYPVKSYRGCWCNIVGLPLMLAARMLQKSGIRALPKKVKYPSACRQCPDR
ncbi:MAG: septum formation protein Maf [Elusimicrobia bacterium]|nr:septum formation protein Maf [Elusimicrobiota bacterium]